MDHGYEVNEDKRCSAKTQKLRQCALPPLRGIDLCALHSGLARPKGSPSYGDLKALEVYKRTEAARGGRSGR
jgi:hypothetical protein